MVLVISQETFNEAVNENINDLGMSPEEAVEEAIKQFEAQGVDLSTIMKGTVAAPDNSAEIKELIQKLNSLNTKPGETEEVTEVLKSIKAECDKGLPQKVFAGKEGAYDALIKEILNHRNDHEIVKHSLRALHALMTKQPDLLDERGVKLILEFMDHNVDMEIKKASLKWAKECCIMHEMNRQALFEANVSDQIKLLIQDGKNEALKETLGLIRALVLDDDVRVEFGKAHEHARIIANETLCHLVEVLFRVKHDEGIVSDLLITLASLLVRNEFCKKVEDAGGLQLIHSVMEGNPDSQKINKQCFKLLKSLAGNDDCKRSIVQNQSFAKLIATNLEALKGDAATATSALTCIAALTLRSPENSKLLFEAKIPEVIAHVMQLHPKDPKVQKAASWAIRNMVSRSRYQASTFLEFGVEDLLKRNLNEFKEFQYDTKAALRDLGCEVELKEEWTGKGGLLNCKSSKTEEDIE